MALVVSSEHKASNTLDSEIPMSGRVGVVMLTHAEEEFGRHSE